MMYRTTIVVVVALAACVQVIAGATLEAARTAPAVDTVAQKLEDHLYGVNLDNKITLDECKAAFNEFEQWDRQTYQMQIYEGPLAVARDYLSDFLHKYLKQDLEGKLTEEFIAKLESSYEKVRPTYAHKTPLQCGDNGVPTKTPKTCALVASLTGEGQPLTTGIFRDSWNEIYEMAERVFAIPQDGRIYEDTDEFLELFKAYNTPEVDALYMTPTAVVKLLTKESKKKLRHGDQEEIQKYMDAYKNELAKCVAHGSE